MDDPESALAEYINLSGSPHEISSKLAVLAIVVKIKPEIVVENPALLNCLVVAAKSEEAVVVEGLGQIFLHRISLQKV